MLLLALMLLFRLVRAAAAAKWRLSWRGVERRPLLQIFIGSAGADDDDEDNYEDHEDNHDDDERRVEAAFATNLHKECRN